MKMFSSTAIYIFSLAAIAAITEPWAEAVSLRAQTPARSSSPHAVVVRNRADSPADIEEAEEEEEVLDQGAANDQPPVSSIPASQTQLPLQQAANIPQQTSPMAMQQMQYTDNPVPPVVLNRAQWSALSAERQAVESTPPRSHPPLPSAIAAGGAHVGSPHIGLMRANFNLTEEASIRVKPKDWPPMDDSVKVCDPPCIKGKGICNDRVCFCISPYSGSTCQHKETGLYRAPKIMVVGFGVISFFLGLIMAKMLMAILEGSNESRKFEALGNGKRRFELWAPPAEDRKMGAK